MKSYQKVMNMSKMPQLKHAPTLNTVLMVEYTLKNTKEDVISVAELKRRLPRQVNHTVLIDILKYLEASEKIVTSLEGVTWIHNPVLWKALQESEKDFKEGRYRTLPEGLRPEEIVDFIKNGS